MVEEDPHTPRAKRIKKFKLFGVKDPENCEKKFFGNKKQKTSKRSFSAENMTVKTTIEFDLYFF